MLSQSEQLKLLIAELHQINQEFADAARPLERLEELNSKARDQLGKELRARLARWEEVTRRIHQFLDQPADVDSISTT